MVCPRTGLAHPRRMEAARMSEKWKEDFKGTGPLKPLVDQVNEVFETFNNIEIKMPKSYSGPAPTLVFDRDGKLVFDFQEALIFTLRNVRWKLTGGVSYNSYSVKVVDGKLVISVSASSICP